MEIGVHLPTTLPPETQRDGLVTFAREAERREVASLWVSDHVIIPHVATRDGRRTTFHHPPDRPYLEAVTALTAAAMCTERPRLGASVFILGHRHPILMAKMLSGVDSLSQGRLICGVGVGWWEQELETLGTPFHARGRQADECLRIFKELWTADHPAFDGEFFRFRDIGFAPRPVQKPHPPIWVGGASPAAYRRVVALGDGWHANPRTPDQFREGLARIRAIAEAAHRPLDTITFSIRFGLGDDLIAKGPQAIVDQLAEFKRLGVTHALVEFRRPELARMVEILDLVTGTIRPALDKA